MNTIARKIAKNSFFNFINNSVGFICALALSIIAARFLGPTVLGKYALVAFVITIAGLITNFGLTGLTTKYISEYSGVENLSIRNQIVAYVLKIKIIASLAAYAIILLSANFFAKFYNDSHLAFYLIILSLSFLPSGLATIFNSIFTGMQEYKYVAMRTTLLYPVNVIAMFIVLKLGFGIMGFIWVNVAYSLIECIFYFVILRNKTQLTLDFRLSLPPEVRKKILRYNWQVAVIVLLNYVVWQRSEVFFLGKFHPAAQTGFYSLAYGIIEKVQTFLPAIFSGVLMPVFSELYGKNQIDNIRKLYINSTRYLLFISLPITAGVICLSKQITLLLYGNAYLPIVPVLNILLVSGCFAIVASAGSSVLYATENQYFLLKWGFLMTALNITLDLVLIPKFAAVGAAMANSITQIIAVTGWITKVTSSLSIKFPTRDLLKIAFAASGMAIICITISKLFNYFYCQWLALIVGLCVYLILILLTKFFTLTDKNLFSSFKDKIPEFIYKKIEHLIFFSLKPCTK
jgi:O-antigen/teichoic acid export membrane protein